MWGIIGAMDSEISLLRTKMRKEQEIRRGNKAFYRGYIEEQPVVVNSCYNRQVVLPKLFLHARRGDVIRGDGHAESRQVYHRGGSAADLVLYRNDFGMHPAVFGRNGLGQSVRSSLHGVRRFRNHVENRDVSHGLLRIPVFLQGFFHCGESHLVHPKRPGQRMLLHLLDVFLFAHDDAALRTPQQLVAAEQHHVDAGVQGCGNVRLVQAVFLKVHHQSVAHVKDDRQVVLLADCHQILQGCFFRKAHNPVVTGVNLHQRAGLLRIDGVDVVRRLRLVGGADIPQSGTALLHDIRNSEGAADFHQLPSGHDYFLALCHRRQNDHGGGGVVVHQHGILCPGEFADQLGHDIVTGAAFSGFHVVFQIGIPLGHRRHVLHLFFAKRRSAQIGVENRSRGIDHRIQVVAVLLFHIRDYPVGHSLDIHPADIEFLQLLRAHFQNFISQILNDAARRLRNDGAAGTGEKKLQPAGLQHFIYLRNSSENFIFFHKGLLVFYTQFQPI